ncbi:MAG: hypothetical protein KKB31_04785, partial [Nanoarchaeota archaeon]|nr:hypothetical protein [Nanoarchaeota archaeon]
MESGYQPIRLSGIIPVGEYDKGATFSFTIEYDVSELALQTYTSSININAVDKKSDSSINKVLKYQITVTGSKPSAYVGNTSTITTFPSCSLPSTNLVVNNTYELVCSNVVDPNINIRVNPDLDFFKGISVVSDEETNQFKWKFQPLQLGETKLKVSYLLMGNPVGPTESWDVRVSANPLVYGTAMKFVLFGPNGKIDNCEGLKDNDKLVVQVRDNTSENIIASYDIYRDGVRLSENSFNVEKGRNYLLSATSPNYNSIDYTCSISSQPISVSIYPTDVEINFPITITTNPTNVTLYWEDTVIDTTYTPTVLGIHKLKAEKSGYETTEKNVEVKEQLRFLTEVPKKISKGKEVVIELNRPIYWTLSYSEKNETWNTLHATTSSQVLFTPEEKGNYVLSIKGEDWSWKVGGLSWVQIALIVVGGLIGLYLLLNYLNKNRGQPTEDTMMVNLGDNN